MRQLESLERMVRENDTDTFTVQEWDRVARTECGSGKALTKAIEEQGSARIKRRCFQCGRVLGKSHKGAYVEMATDGKFYRDGVPSDQQSQGCFAFGSTCVKKVLRTGGIDWQARSEAMERLRWDGSTEG